MNVKNNMFHFGPRRLVTGTLSIGISLLLLGGAFAWFSHSMTPFIPFVRLIGRVCLGFGTYYLLVGVVSLLFSNMRYAVMDSEGITFFTGFVGFRRPTHVSWENIVSATVTEKDEYVRVFPPLILGDSIIPAPVKVLLLKMSKPLEGELKSQLLSLFTKVGPNLHHIRSNQEGTEIWLTSEPKEGFDSLQATITSFINKKSSHGRGLKQGIKHNQAMQPTANSGF